MLPASRTHPRLHRRNLQINFLIVTNHRYVLKDSDLFEVYNPELDATIVIAMNSDKKVNGEQGINVLLRDISKILFPNNPVNVPVIK